jgi:hypothetical protein
MLLDPSITKMTVGVMRVAVTRAEAQRSESAMIGALPPAALLGTISDTPELLLDTGEPPPTSPDDAGLLALALARGRPIVLSVVTPHPLDSVATIARTHPIARRRSKPVFRNIDVLNGVNDR